jgi:hypothetical protein
VHPKVALFLRERDRARERGDRGVIRSTTADLRRLGVSDDATLAHPSGKPSRARREPEKPVEVVDAPVEKPKGGRPRLPRCEHENIADRCTVCNPELLAS